MLLPRATPESQGVSSRAVLAFLDAAESFELHSFMLVRRGFVVAEGWWAPFSPKRVHRLHSLSKSFTSTAIGLLVDDGKLTVQDKVVSFFPEDLPPEVGEHLAAMTVQDLLTMRTGHAEDATGPFFATPDTNWTRAFFAHPVDFAPGTHFVYDSAATYLLSAIVQKVAGETVLDFLRPRLLEPLGIEGARWQSSPQGVNVGGWGLHARTEDVAKFGQLYLQRGRWEERQLVSAAWVDEATSAHVPPGPEEANDWARGYGYQFWRCRHGAYRGDGAFGQFCVVLPEHGAVLAITASTPDMQGLLNVAWTHLLPGLHAETLPEDAAGQAALRSRAASLTLRVPTGEERRDFAGGTFAFEPNEAGVRQVDVRPDEAGCRLAVGTHVHRFRFGAWEEGTTTLGELTPEVVLGTAAWTSPTTLSLTALYVEAGYRYEATLNEADGTLTVRLPMTLGSSGGALVGRRLD